MLATTLAFRRLKLTRSALSYNPVSPPSHFHRLPKIHGSRRSPISFSSFWLTVACAEMLRPRPSRFFSFAPRSPRKPVSVPHPPPNSTSKKRASSTSNTRSRTPSSGRLTRWTRTLL